MNQQEARAGSAPEARESRPNDADDLLLKFADRLRRSDDERDEDEESPETWVAFHLAGRGYALPVTHVFEFAKIGKITGVPGAPSSVRGVASLRGHAIPIVDLKARLGLESEKDEPLERALIVDHRGRRIGLVVDRVDRVFKLLPSLIRKVPDSGSETRSEKVFGFYEADGEDLALLDAERFLS